MRRTPNLGTFHFYNSRIMQSTVVILINYVSEKKLIYGHYPFTLTLLYYIVYSVVEPFNTLIVNPVCRQNIESHQSALH